MKNLERSINHNQKFNVSKWVFLTLIATIILITLTLLHGCGGEGESSSDNQSVTNILPPDPGLANNLTIEGVDSNANGIRDDIERYIALTYTNSPEITGGLEKIAILEQELIKNHTNKEVVISLTKRADPILSCMMLTLPINESREIIKSFQKKIYNTKARIKVLAQTQKHLKGIDSFPTSMEFERTCREKYLEVE